MVCRAGKMQLGFFSVRVACGSLDSSASESLVAVGHFHVITSVNLRWKLVFLEENSRENLLFMLTIPRPTCENLISDSVFQRENQLRIRRARPTVPDNAKDDDVIVVSVPAPTGMQMCLHLRKNLAENLWARALQLPWKKV